MKTKEVFKNMNLVSGGIALLSAAGITYAISKQLIDRRTYKRPFDSNNIVEADGRIQEVKHTEEKKDEARGVYLDLQADDEVIQVHVGPAWFVDYQQESLTPGDKITVKGSKTKYQGQECIIATTIRRGSEEFKLRNDDGAPYWYWKE